MYVPWQLDVRLHWFTQLHRTFIIPTDKLNVSCVICAAGFNAVANLNPPDTLVDEYTIAEGASVHPVVVDVVAGAVVTLVVVIGACAIVQLSVV